LIFENQYIQERIKKTEKLREEGINPYPNQIKKGTPSAQFLAACEYIKEQDADEKKDASKTYSLTGRLKFIRIMGKAAFAKIEDAEGLVQIYYNRDELPEGFYNNVAKKLFEVGDIIEATGYPFITQTGELTLHCKEMKIVSKSISPLPEKFHGLQDHELRYRQRYLDMIMNPEVKKNFEMRSRIVSMVRRFFEDKTFLEVETPMLHPIPGGANAKPFITHHNALGVDRYLRIAPELYLKRLIVGGMEAVFEINRNFRNEGMDHTHNPEFTMIEFYWAYKTYLDLMEITEELFDYLFDNLGLERKLPYGDLEIDFSTPFAKIPYIGSLTSIGGVPEEVANNKEKALAYLKEHKVKVDPKLTLGYLQAELFDEFVEGKLINPTFITTLFTLILSRDLGRLWGLWFHSREKQYIADAVLVGKHHDQSVNSYTFTCSWCHTVRERFNIVCIHMHCFIITCCFFCIYLPLKSIILINRVIEFRETVGYLFSCHEKFKTLCNIRIVIASSGKW